MQTRPILTFCARRMFAIVGQIAWKGVELPSGNVRDGHVYSLELICYPHDNKKINMANYSIKTVLAWVYRSLSARCVRILKHA